MATSKKILDSSDISNVHQVPRGGHLEMGGFDTDEHFLYHCTAQLQTENFHKMLVTCDVVESPKEMAQSKPTAFEPGIFSPLAAWIHDWARAPLNWNYPIVRLYRDDPDRKGGVYAEGRVSRTLGPIHCPLIVPPNSMGGHIIDLSEIGAVQVWRWSKGEPPMNVDVEAGEFIYRHPDLPDGPWRQREDPMMAA